MLTGKHGNSTSRQLTKVYPSGITKGKTSLHLFYLFTYYFTRFGRFGRFVISGFSTCLLTLRVWRRVFRQGSHVFSKGCKTIKKIGFKEMNRSIQDKIATSAHQRGYETQYHLILQMNHVWKQVKKYLFRPRFFMFESSFSNGV